MASTANEHVTGKNEKYLRYLTAARRVERLTAYADIYILAEQRIHFWQHTLFQAFDWHTPSGGKHWQWLKSQLPQLAGMGITAVWIPPPTKGGSPESNGYDAYDLWDLGEFDAKGSRATKWGTIEDLRELIKAAEELKIMVIADAVLNHKDNGDRKETFKVKEVAEEDRNQTITDAYDIEGWTAFDFAERGDKYSNFKYRFEHFTAVGYDDKAKKNGIFKIEGENRSWAQTADTSEKGSYDFLMACDIDHHHGDVQKDMFAWGHFMIEDMGFRGFRFDAARHMSENFIRNFVKEVRQKADKPLFMVGEFFHEDLGALLKYLERFGDQFSLFDVPLHSNFHRAGMQMREFDLSKIFDGSLVQARPVDSVTFCANHDTQPGQTCEAVINPAFRPLAYALILLRFEGYPCVFAGDLWGIKGGPQEEKPVTQLADLIGARRDFAYGRTTDYLDHPDCIGWVRAGDDEHDGCAVVLCTGDEGRKHMQVGEEHKGEKWTDLLGWHQGEVTIGDDGWADFLCPAESLSIWTKVDARRRDRYKQ